MPTRRPPLTPDDPATPAATAATRTSRSEQLPLAESLKDTVARFLPYWHERIAPEVRAGRRVIIAAHGNSLRALVKYLDGVSEDEIVGLNIPTGIPLVYELDDDLRPIRQLLPGRPGSGAQGGGGRRQPGLAQALRRRREIRRPSPRKPGPRC